MIDDLAILEALQKATTVAVETSIAPTLPIKFVGRSLEIPDDQKWLEVVFLPNNRSDFWGEEKNYQGTYRLILHWPNDDAGAYPALLVLGSVTGHFTKDLQLPNVQIYETPSLTGTLEMGTETLYPASLRYQSFR